MLVFESWEEIPADFGPTVVTVGNFDGIHRAHRQLIAAIAGRARELNACSVVVTFDPHPTRILRPHAGPPLLTPMPEKLNVLGRCGVDAVLVAPFTRDLSLMAPYEFAEELLVNRLHAVEVHEGFNFRFGHKGEGTVARLQEFGRKLGFTVVVHQPMQWGGLVISSSNVRAELLGGRIEAARHLLGRAFSICSTPGRGRGYGTRYTVPTVNLARYEELIPGFGVYVTELEINGEVFESVTNVGNRPTFGPDSFAIESYILNFHPLDLSADTPLRLSFLHRLRGEIKFPSVEALKAQIGRDVARAQRYFRMRSALRKHR